MRTPLLLILLAAPALVAGKPAPLRLIPVEGGGYEIARDAAVEPVEATGLATVAEIVPLLTTESIKGEKVDYGNGKKLEGVYTVIVGREDGTLGKYKGATEIIIFAAPDTMTKTGGVTTLDGAIVFALKIDNNKRVAQRFERGTITLTKTKKSV